MKNWKNWLVPALWAFGGVLMLVLAVLKPLIKGEPFNTALLAVAFMYLTFAVGSFAAGRKSGASAGLVPDGPGLGLAIPSD